MIDKNKQHVILVVDDDEQVLDFTKHLLSIDSINVLTAKNLTEANNIVDQITIHLLITDYYLPDGECLTLIRKVREETSSLPVIVMTGGDEDLLKLPVIECGANFLLTKPVRGKEFKGIVTNLLSLFDAYENLENAQAIIVALSRSIDTRDKYTDGHSRRVAEYSTKLYDLIGYDDYTERQALYIGCLLHDIGKIGVPDSILKSNKNPLSKEEYNQIKTHPIMGYDICKDITKIQSSLDVIKHHHEKVDGSGYPNGLKGDEIPHIVQIVTITDVYDALTSKRFYREANTPQEAIEIMEIKEKGKLNSYFFELFKQEILKDII